MSTDNRKAENKSRKSRPIGVWILTIYALLFGGIYILLFTDVFYVLQGYIALYSKNEVPAYYVYALLSISIIVTSMLTWGGLEIGRKSFLVFTTLLFLGDGISNYGWFTWIPDSDDIGGWVWYITDFVFPTLCIWYFNKPSVKEFFRKS